MGMQSPPESREGLLEHARDALTSGIKQRKEKTVGEIESVAVALHEKAQQIQQQRGPGSRSMVEQAAQQIDRVASYLKDAEPEDLLREVDRFARREPVLFLGGAFVAGLLVSRFIKATGHTYERHDVLPPFDPTYEGGGM
jgi:predicted component of type VI protein secretion system